MIKLFSTFLLAGLLLASPLPSSAAETSPETLVRETTTNVLDRLRQEANVIAGNPQRLDEIAREEVLPHFDFQRMSQRVLGPHWRDASQEQKNRFVEEFTRLLVRTYATAVYEYRESKVSFQPARELSAGILRIRTDVDRGDGRTPLQVDYDLYQKEQTWKVLDVAINGISLVVSYRAGFNTDIGKLGMDGLITQMADHNAKRTSANN